LPQLNVLSPCLKKKKRKENKRKEEKRKEKKKIGKHNNKKERGAYPSPIIIHQR
jgi:hypothetical protein